MIAASVALCFSARLRRRRSLSSITFSVAFFVAATLRAFASRLAGALLLTTLPLAAFSLAAASREPSEGSGKSSGRLASLAGRLSKSSGRFSGSAGSFAGSLADAASRLAGALTEITDRLAYPSGELVDVLGVPVARVLDARRGPQRALLAGAGVAQLVNTRAGAAYGRPDYVASGCGIGREATLYLLERGVRLTGTDGWSWDAPFVHTKGRYAETGDAGLIWEGHKAGREIGYCHLEKLHNLESLPAHGFTVSCFPVKIRGASAGWTRAVAILDE